MISILLIDSNKVLAYSSTTNYIFWYAVYGALFLLFYIFSSPFTGNRELRKQWTGYVYVSTFLYIWLGVAVAFHLPILHYDVQVPISMFSPLFLASVLTLLACELVLKLLNRWFVFHVGFKQNSLEVIQSSVILSIICCVVYTQCGSTTSSVLEQFLATAQDWSGTVAAATIEKETPFDATIDAVCVYIFGGHTNSTGKNLPTVLVLWSTGISMIVLNYALERLATTRALFDEYKTNLPNRHKSISTQSTSHLSAQNSTTPSLSPALSPLSYLSSVSEYMSNELLEPSMLDMVSWYAIAASYTLVDLIIHLKLFVGRFDMRTLQSAMPNSFHYTLATPINLLPPAPSNLSKSVTSILEATHMEGIPAPSLSINNSLSEYNMLSSSNHIHRHHLDSPFYYDHLQHETELWFDWMSDCGDGFNPSYQVARMLAQPSLRVNVKRKSGRSMGVLQLPRAKVLFLGGDLAYPAPSAYNYENRFFGPFQLALPPPIYYDPNSISIQKPACTGGLAGLSSYHGPQCFAIPGNHDWFDGLQTYLRYICSRDWLGGWLLPQEKSWFCLKLPCGWWVFGLDNALAFDIDIQQFQYFARIASMMNDNDRVILMYHEPDWVINAHEKTEVGLNLFYLQTMLAGKVVLKLAGDLHHYTRHMPVQPHNTTPTHQQTNEDGDSRWTNPFLAITSLVAAPREPSSRVYMEDLLEEIAPDITQALTMNRTQSMPDMSSINTSVASTTGLTSPVLFTPLDTNSSSSGNPNRNSSSTSAAASVAKELLHRRTFSLVNSPPPSPLHSGMQTPIGSPYKQNDVKKKTHHLPQYPMQSEVGGIKGKFVPLSSRATVTGEQSIFNSQSTPFLSDVHIQDDVDHLYSASPSPISPTVSDIITWSVDDVAEWLEFINLSDLIPLFKSHCIDGKLLSSLDDDDLFAELKIESRLKRKKLLIERDQLISQTKEQLKENQVASTNGREGEAHIVMDHFRYSNQSGKSFSESISQTQPSIITAPLTATNRSIHSKLDVPVLLPTPSSNLHDDPSLSRSESNFESDANDVVEEYDETISPQLNQPNHLNTGNNKKKKKKIKKKKQLQAQAQGQSQPHSQAQSESHQTEAETNGHKFHIPPFNGDTSADNSSDDSLHMNDIHVSLSHRQSAVRSPPILIVSGGGGAFMHPTHVPSPEAIDVHGDTYVRSVSYPSLSTSRSYALLNLFGFRKRNWRFDILGGIIYFLLVFSMLPLCDLSGIITAKTWYEVCIQFVWYVILVHIQMFDSAWMSLVVFSACVVGFISFTESNWPMWKRVVTGVCHTLGHSISAFSALVFMETFVELGLKRRLLGQSESLIGVLTHTFPSARIALTIFDEYTYHLSSFIIRTLTAIFDVPEAMANLKLKMCAAYPYSLTSALSFFNQTIPKAPSPADIALSLANITRSTYLCYYLANGLYLWVMCTSLVSFVFGAYLYITSCYFNAHATEAFSSLRVEGYKNFLRFHLNRRGDMEIFVLGMDRVPRRWERDPLWSGWVSGGEEREKEKLKEGESPRSRSSGSGSTPSWQWSVPSLLKAESFEPDGIRLIDYIIIRKDDSVPEGKQ